MTVTKDNEYAIILSEKFKASNDDHNETLLEGSLIKIETMDAYGTFTFTCVDEANLNPYKISPVCKSSTFEGILPFSSDVFKFAVAIYDRKDRIKFCQSDEKLKFILQTKLNDSVLIPLGAFDTNNKRPFARAFVKYIGLIDEIGPGFYFIATIMRRDWCPVPPVYNQLISKYVGTEDNHLSIILSANYLYDQHTENCPDVELFRLYTSGYFGNMNRKSEPAESRITKEQAHQKRNSSSLFEKEATSYRNNSKIVPEKPFHLDGKDIYVIDSTNETDNADVQIVQPDRYVDRSAILFSSGHWPSAVPQSEMLNGKYEESPSSGANSTKSARTGGRSKSSNPLNHLNQDNRNSNRAVSPSGVQSKYSLRSRQRIPAGSYDNNVNHAIHGGERPESFSKIPGSILGIDAMVTVETGVCEPLNGVIRAIFKFGNIIMVGVELEDVIPCVPLNLTDGSFSGHRFFHCQEGKALFVEAECCHKDNRFSDDFIVESKVFGHAESPVVTENIPPISLKDIQELEEIIGESKGIQGHNNSCYLDATLFSMFTFAQCFDSLLYRPADKKDIQDYDQVRAILRDEIVHPLRKHHFVRADKVLKLRVLLEKISKMTGLTNEEKDPEEFMNILMAQTLKAEPYLKFNSGQDAFYYQLFVEKNDELTLPNVQQLFEQSFKTSNIKLREVPPCLIIQMPRFGKNYKMYQRIVPSQVLDITDVVEGQPPACAICGALANVKCMDCPKDYCATCFQIQHQHQNHNHKAVDMRNDYPTLLHHQTVPRIHMDLFAVVCIETSHYVSFVKAGELPDAPWLFFDSMSDRRGGQNGYNIPSMVSIPDLPEWLSEEGARKLHESTPKDKLLPPFAKRLLCDAYMCMYVSRDVSMYK